MPAKITYSIGASNFETIRDTIGSILFLELGNQAILQGTGNPLVLNPNFVVSIYTERFTPINSDEGNVIIVKVDKVPLDNQTPISQRAKPTYFIDVYCDFQQTSTVEGYLGSATRLQKLCGAIRHILQSPYYDKLGLTDGTIGSRSVSNIEFDSPNDNNDAKNSRMARITLDVEMNETQNQITPIIASGYDTQVKLESTNKGYKFTKNN